MKHQVVRRLTLRNHTLLLDRSNLRHHFFSPPGASATIGSNSRLCSSQSELLLLLHHAWLQHGVSHDLLLWSVLSGGIGPTKLLSLLLLLEVGHHLLLLVLLLLLLLGDEELGSSWSALLLIVIDEVKEAVELCLPGLRLLRLLDQLKHVTDVLSRIATTKTASTNVKYATVEHANVLC